MLSVVSVFNLFLDWPVFSLTVHVLNNTHLITLDLQKSSLTWVYLVVTSNIQFKINSQLHLNKISEGVVDVGSFREEEAASWADLIKEEELLVLCRNSKCDYSILFEMFSSKMVSILLFLCACGLSSSPPPAPSPTPPCLYLLETPHPADETNLRAPFDWSVWRRTSGATQSRADGEKRERKQGGNKQVVKEKWKGQNWTDGWRVSGSLEQKYGLWQTQHPANNISSPTLWWNSSLPIKETAPWINKENSISVSHMGPKETDSYWWDYVACVITACATNTKKNKQKNNVWLSGSCPSILELTEYSG